MKVAIVTDSAVDLPIGFEKSFLFVIPVQIIAENESYSDGEVPQDLFNRLFKNAELSTSQPSINDFIDLYTRLLENYDKVLSIHISRFLSGTSNAARNAISEMGTNDILIFDTHNVSIGASFFVMMACHLIEKGVNIYEIEKILFFSRKKIEVRVIIDDVRYIQKSGRINLFVYSILKFFKIKPIISVKEGNLKRHSFSLGKKLGIRSMINDLPINKDQNVFLGSTGDPETVENIFKKLEGDVSNIYKCAIGLALKVHVGPNAFGIASVPSNNSILSQYKKEIINKVYT